MNLLILCTLFIVQFVGHRIGDFILQTDYQATNKTTNSEARFMHCLVYSATIAILSAFIAPTWTMFVFIITLIEHYLIDDRRFVIWLKTFIETKIVGNKNFDISNIPGFVIIEIDQTIHYTRILIISAIIAYFI